MIIQWEVASAKTYRIDESIDGIAWYTVAQRTDMDDGARTDTINNLEGGSRYIRMYGISRTTSYGFSIYEFEVYGSENLDAKPVGDLITTTQEISTTLWKVYPTVVHVGENITIDQLDHTSNIVSIYGMNGALIMSEQVHSQKATIEINSRFKPGVYVIHINSETELVGKRFIVM